MAGPEIWHVLEGDDADVDLVASAHPAGWTAPDPAPLYDLVVLGAGTAGLVAATGAAALGARVALVEQGLLGGDCLVYGCVPSKALLRSARAAAAVRAAPAFGIAVGGPVEVDFPAVMERLRRVRARIGAHDAAARLKGLGVDVFFGPGRFLDGRSVGVGGRVLRFAKALVATGAGPAIPDIPGLEAAGYLTNETVFTLTRRPGSLAIIGGGPVGCELGQAFARLGSKVTIVQRAGRLLPREEPETSRLLERVLTSEGLDVRTGARVAKVEARGGLKVLSLGIGGVESTVEAEEILLAAGRVPNVRDAGLEAAGVAYDPASGVKVDGRLRTTNRRVYAAGDAGFPLRHTHAAEATARLALQNALFLPTKRTSSLVIPECVFTDPEVARVGPTEADAAARGLAVRAYIRRLDEVDRAVVDGEETGFAKVLIGRGGRILGATVVGRHAGESIGEIAALAAGRKRARFLAASVIHPYPTLSEAAPRAASRYFEGWLKPGVRRLLRLWFAWRR